jgi:hypothetical protein
MDSVGENLNFSKLLASSCNVAIPSGVGSAGVPFLIYYKIMATSLESVACFCPGARNDFCNY